MLSWWTPLTTAMAQWPHVTTNFLPPGRAAVLPMPTTPVPSLVRATVPLQCRGLWTTHHPKAPGTTFTQTRTLRLNTTARRTHWWLPRQSQASLQPHQETVYVACAEPHQYMTWKGLGPTPTKWHSGTDMPVKVSETCLTFAFLRRLSCPFLVIPHGLLLASYHVVRNIIMSFLAIIYT